MKNKIIVSSILTIALCLSMIAGSTFALFTSKSQVDVAVTSGKVKITATATDLDMDSTLGDPLGSAKLETVEGIQTLTISNFVPGDYVTFSLVVHNDSNVAINYKTIIKKAADTGLFAGLVVTIGDEDYSGSLVTSPWAAMQPGDPDVTVKVKVALPETAGNIYQNKSCSISYMVQAVQGNAPLDTEVTDAGKLQEVIGSGVGEVTLTESVTTDAIVVKEGITTIDLNGNELTSNENSAIVNENGTLTIKNGTIKGNVENQADAEITDTDINAVGDKQYGGTSTGANANTVYEDVDIFTYGGGIKVLYGATATFKSGSIDIQNVKSRHLFYAGSDTEATSVLIIEDGKFNLRNKTVNSSYIVAEMNAVVYITGGEFDAASSKADPIREVNGGQVIITGGTFKWDPTEWVADGYVAVEDNGVWTVTAK